MEERSSRPEDTPLAGPPSSTLAPWLLRLFRREYHPETEIQKRHRQMIELIWSRQGMAERYYVTMRPKGVSFGVFVRQVTDLVCRGAAEGWIAIRIPLAPAFDENAYHIEYLDPERFVAEMEALFAGTDAED